MYEKDSLYKSWKMMSSIDVCVSAFPKPKQSRMRCIIV